jgi:ATP-dependent RNA helicase DeaD
MATAMRERGFTQLTKIQEAVLAHQHDSANLRMSSETGSGKTLAIGLVLADSVLQSPAGKRVGPSALIITPTRELAMQVCGELTWLFEQVPNIIIEVVTGGIDIRGDRRRLAKRPQILVATPGRLLDHIRAGAVDCSAVAQVVLDEADRMLDMGFRDELDAIVAELPEQRRSHLVSATFPRAVKELARRFQGEGVRIEGTSLGAPNRDIETTAYLVSPHNLYPALVNLLLLTHGRRCLVFVQRRVDAAELSSKLAGDGFSALPLSGDLSQVQRTRTLEAFRHGIVNTLIATDVAARGIDVADIATVIHADIPSDAASYTHRSGRTGRAGRKGSSLLLVPHRAERRVRMVLQEAKVDVNWAQVPSPQAVRKSLAKRLRRELHARLSEGAEHDGPELEPIGEPELEYAAKLLADHDPQRLVATLLAMATPKLPREPMGPEPGPAHDQSRPRHERGERHERSDRHERGERHDRSDRHERSERGRGRDLDPNLSFVRFEINWGEHGGATAGRLLAHVCRRGGITSRSIGPVKIGRRSSQFEVARDVADGFASKVAVPDSRDPKLHIRRLNQSEAEV